MTLTTFLQFSWQDFAIIFLIIYSLIATYLLFSGNELKHKLTQVPSIALGEDDERRPCFYAQLTDKKLTDYEDKKHVQLTLTLTNYGKQTAFDTKAMWFDDSDNWPEWNTNSDLSFENPLKVGDVERNRRFNIELACEVEKVIDKKGNDIFFYFFAIELEFKQSNGETCNQVISCLNFSDEFYLEDSGNVARYFK